MLHYVIQTKKVKSEIYGKLNSSPYRLPPFQKKKTPTSLKNFFWEPKSPPTLIVQGGGHQINLNEKKEKSPDP